MCVCGCGCDHSPLSLLIQGNAGNGIAHFDDGSPRWANCPNRVPITTVDNIVKEDMSKTIGAVVGIKMDIEGYETRATLGALDFLRRSKPCFIWFEYVEEAIIATGKGKHQMLNALHDLGYRLHDIATPHLILQYPWSLPRAMFFEASLPSCDLHAIQQCGL